MQFCFTPVVTACACNTLTGLQGLPGGDAWQRQVLLCNSRISLDRWLSRRMLRHGCCHFCCE